MVELSLKSHLDHPLHKDIHGLLPFSTFIQLLKASGSGLKTGLKPMGEEEKGGIFIICLHDGMQVPVLLFGCEHLSEDWRELGEFSIRGAGRCSRSHYKEGMCRKTRKK